MRSLSLSPPPAPIPFLRMLGLQLGLEGGTQLSHIWQASSLTEGRKGAAGAASMLYCFPPGTLFLLERPKWYSGGKERARGKLGRGSLSVQASSPGPSTFTRLPLPLTPASPTPRKAAGRAAAAERLVVGRRGQGTRARAPRGGRCGRP